MTRIKGQEVALGFTSPSGDEDPFGEVKSFEFELDIELLREGYLGKTAEAFDDIYNGVTGNAELHLSAKEYFVFTEKVQDRAERRTAAGGTFTVTGSFAFPDGSRARLTFENIFFGAMPVKVSDRKSYVAVTVNWGCERIRRVL